MVAWLSCNIQNFVLITLLELRGEQNKISIELELQRNKANLKHLIAATGLAILNVTIEAKLANCFGLCDLKLDRCP